MIQPRVIKTSQGQQCGNAEKKGVSRNTFEVNVVDPVGDENRRPVSEEL